MGLLLNITLLLLIVWFFRSGLKNPQDQNLWIGYIILKIIAACGFIWIYGYHYSAGDMINYLHDAEAYRTLGFYDFIINLINPNGPTAIIDELTYDFDRRAMLMAKFTAASYYLSGNAWLTAMNFSIIGGLITFRFFLTLKDRFRELFLPGIIALLLFPSLLFWTSGICKEAISFPAMLLVFIPLLKLDSKELSNSWLDWILALIGAVVLWYLKYYVAAIVLPACLLYAVSTYLDWYPYRKLVIGLLTFIGLLLLVSQLHPNLYLHRTMQVMVDNYELTISQTEPGKTAYYEGLSANLPSFLYHFPEAVFTGLFMPLIGQHWDLPSLLVVIQNSALLLSLLILMIALIIKRIWLNIPVSTWSALFIIVLLAGLIAITTPNFGTLDRYRVAYQPFLVLIVVAGLQEYLLPRKID
ncbi:MAG: hypothetical protein AAGC88_03815 [Bacteroidota bacterium]